MFPRPSGGLFASTSTRADTRMFGARRCRAGSGGLTRGIADFALSPTLIVSVILRPRAEKDLRRWRQACGFFGLGNRDSFDGGELIGQRSDPLPF